MKAAAVASAPMGHPADFDGLDAALATAGMAPAQLVAIWVKTEGNGLGNDFTRPYTESAAAHWLAQRRGVDPARALREVQVLVSGGAEGVISPHVLALGWCASSAAPHGNPKRLVAGKATARLDGAQAGSPAHIAFTTELVRAAMADAGLSSPADVHGVVVRAPSLPGLPAHAARVRASGALGVAVALCEAQEAAATAALGDAARTVWSDRAFVVARPGDDKQQVVLVGNAAGAPSRHAAAHAALADPLDTPALARMLAALGLEAAPQLSPAQSARVAAVLVKGDPPPQGTIRGRRHAMSTDADVAGHRHARAAFGALAAGAIGHTAILAGAGAEHHGPPGGGLAFVVARME